MSPVAVPMNGMPFEYSPWMRIQIHVFFGTSITQSAIASAFPSIPAEVGDPPNVAGVNAPAAYSTEQVKDCRTAGSHLDLATRLVAGLVRRFNLPRSDIVGNEVRRATVDILVRGVGGRWNKAARRHLIQIERRLRLPPFC